ncbi:MAG: hypothetical protein KIT14_22760, partial [bacterium]|nr:hypothetical protein [bacterium]
MTRGLALGLLCVAAAAGAAPFEVRTVPHPYPAAGDFFGASVALRGGRLVVGAPRRDQPGAADAGAVYVFDAGSGALLHALVAPAPIADARLGSAVAAVGADVVAGAPHEDSGAPHAGAVHVFALAGGTHLRTVPNPEPALDDGFGGAVAGAGGDLVIGARLDGAGIADGGAAYVVGAGTAPRLTLLAPTPAAYALVGASVATDGSVAVVGAPGDATVAPNGGAAHVFALATGTWIGTLRPTPPALGDDFGRALAVGAGLIVVGAPLDEAENVSDAGTVYVYDAATLAFRLRLTSPQPVAGGRFGTAVALRGTDIVVGAPHEGSGVVHLFTGDGVPLGSIANPTPAPDDQFGAALASEGMVLAVGAWHDDAGANDAGAVHVIVDLGAPSVTTTTVAGVPPTSVTSTTATSVTLPTPVTTTTVVDGASTTTSTSVATSTTTPGSIPLATTTTTAVSASTTTTTPPSGEVCDPAAPDACDDADACTLDACSSDGRCLHAALGGLDAVSCRLDALGAAMDREG